MRFKFSKLTVLVLSLLSGVNQAHAAGGHYEVDDAALIERGSCELEVWHTRFDGDVSESVLFPACNPWGDLQLGVAAIRASQAGDQSATLAEVEAKTAWQDAEADGWALGLAVLGTWNESDGRYEKTTLLVPLTLAASERLLVNLNAGWVNERDDEDASLWGAGVVYDLHHHLDVIAETSGTHRGETRAQAGLRMIFRDAHIDLGYGRMRRDSSDDWWTVGLARGF